MVKRNYVVMGKAGKNYGPVIYSPAPRTKKGAIEQKKTFSKRYPKAIFKIVTKKYSKSIGN
jgi:hypothetical protein